MSHISAWPSTHAHHMRRGSRSLPSRRGVSEAGQPLTQLIDAKAASKLLGVPYTWLLAQARQRHIPHHRLGHYVRFNPDDLARWLTETRIEPVDRP